MRARGSLLWLLLCLVCASVTPSSALQRSSGSSPSEIRIGFARPGGGYTVQTLPLETYVARVLAGEAARNSEPAALEALAVTIRTFALGNRDRHRADGFDLCDETHCQVVRAATAATERAATATAGQVLMRNGLVASVFYSASCGGRTEIPSDVWPGADDPPYLPTVDDDACAGAPAWTAEIRAADLLRALRAAGFRGERLTGFRIASRNQSGRVARLRVEGLTPREISGQDLRVAVGRTLGWQHIKSTAFELRDEAGVYRFSGHGSGHGVGLCVIGSANLAARGSTATAILAKYFPGAAISVAGPRLTPEPPRVEPLPVVVSRPPPDIIVVLADEDEGEREGLTRVTLAARDEIAQALGVSPPPRLTARFHPTTDSFERATGHPWFTSAWLVAGELHFMPLAGLRERGVLERTIRHELVHAMTAAVLAGRPAWVSEGTAVYFADQRPGLQAAPNRPDLRAACPSDSELEQPASVGELANAYARARVCVARQIAAGKSWRDLK